MENITSAEGLKESIMVLETEQALKLKQLKEQLFVTYKSLEPANMLKNTLSSVASSPYLIENIIGTAAGLATGFISKNFIVGTSRNIFRRLAGTVLQFGVTNLVAQHPGSIQSAGRFLFKRFFHKKPKGAVKSNVRTRT